MDSFTANAFVLFYAFFVTLSFKTIMNIMSDNGANKTDKNKISREYQRRNNN